MADSFSPAECTNCVHLKHEIQQNIHAFRTLLKVNPNLDSMILLGNLDLLVGKKEDQKVDLGITDSVHSTLKETFEEQKFNPENIKYEDSEGAHSVSHEELNQEDDLSDFSSDARIQDFAMESFSSSKASKLPKNPVKRRKSKRQSHLSYKKRRRPFNVNANSNSEDQSFESTIKTSSPPPGTSLSENYSGTTVGILSSSNLQLADQSLRRLSTDPLSHYECLICSAVLTRRTYARLHVRRIHFKERFTCPLNCGKKFYGHKELRKHLLKLCVPQVPLIKQEQEEIDPVSIHGHPGLTIENWTADNLEQSTNVQVDVDPFQASLSTTRLSTRIRNKRMKVQKAKVVTRKRGKLTTRRIQNGDMHEDSIRKIGKAKFECKLCHNKFKHHNTTVIHIRKVHLRVGRRACPSCPGVDFRDNFTYNRHQRRTHGSKIKIGRTRRTKIKVEREEEEEMEIEN